MKYLSAILLTLIFFLEAKTQPQLRTVPCNVASASCRKLTIFHETNSNFGNFNFNSLNLEYLPRCSQTSNIGIRAGFIYLTFPKIKAYGIPLGVSLMLGRGYNQLEIGGGATFLKLSKNFKEGIGVYEDDVSYAGISTVIGFRHHSAEGGLFYRLGFTPIISVVNSNKIPIIADKRFIPLAGLSIGWTF